MDNTIYVALSRHLAEFDDMNVTANNLANANTTGFSAEHILFTSYLSEDENKGDRNPMSYAHGISSYMDTSEGSLNSTGNALDLAITGNGYFTIDTPAGIRYTRAGSFQLNSTGTLITAQGYPVLDDGKRPITFPEEVDNIEVGSAGNIKANGEDFGTLGIARFDNKQLLERVGDTMYKSDAVPQSSEGTTVIQGAIESSNVKPVLELTHMLEVSRSVASTAKLIEVIHDLERKTSNAWAKQGS